MTYRAKTFNGQSRILRAHLGRLGLLIIAPLEQILVRVSSWI